MSEHDPGRAPVPASYEPRGAVISMPDTRVPTGPSGAQTDERLVELWLHGKSQTTRKAYEGDLAKLFDFTGGKPLASVTLADLQEFSDLLDEAVAPATHARTIAALKSLFSFAHDVGYLQFEVTKPLKVPPRKDDLAEKLLSVSEVHDMIAAAKRRSKRDGAMLKLMYAAGLRSAEATGLKWRDVSDRDELEFGRGQITIFGKGGKTRNVLLPVSIHREVSALRQGRAPEDPVFRSRKKGGHLDGSQVRRIVARAGKDAGLEVEVSPHDLRHAHASHSSDSGAPLHLVRATLGHSSIATTGRYLHARPTESSATYLGFS
ncbi:tyrosine-type recombinase/integrase [Rubrobacter aplysinae]|uniref:tyrosine-type recombinase/integrase n=1 Tax=Rubrobacter aplysinae TaxID=909625 RepID=UPI000A5F2E05|nr:tyrosine-type recombinase/integrase [Rubrobacter aplysinae]